MPYTVPNDRSRLQTMLSSMEHGLRHADIQEGRVKEVGEWLIKSKEFKIWRGFEGECGGDEAVLFCYGDPGAGKTFISSLVVDRLLDQARGQNTAVTSFYFDFMIRKELSATAVLGSMLKQIIDGMEVIPADISRGLKEQLSTIYGYEPQLVDIVKILQLMTSSQPTFMCIDGLDECVGMQRIRILDSLKKILERSPGTRIFLTGRPQIRAEIEERLAGRVVSVSICPSKDEIITYLRARLAEDEIPDAMDESLEAEILEKVPENISGIPLLASLSVEAILHETTINLRRERLGKMTNRSGLEGAYDAVMERIKAQDGNESRLGIEALMWISHAERPLTADELCHALAIELGSMDFDADNAPTMLTLLGCCQGLITLDEDPSTVRLIHFTLQEYLSVHSDIFSRPHSTIAETCLTYLNSKHVKALSTDPSSDTQKIPFLGYCSLTWGIHAERDLSDCSSSLALQMFQEYDGHISVKLLREQPGYPHVRRFGANSQFTGLDCASFFGITKLVTAMIKMPCYRINKEDFRGHTPLMWAAHNGHEEVVRILLERAWADPDKPDQDRETPLSHAARNGHEGVVKLLLQQHAVCPDKPCRQYGRTPLSYAAERGHEGVVERLLERQEVNPDKLDKSGRTPLSYAAWCGREEVAKILLKQEGVNPDKPSHNGQTSLSYATQKGYEGVVKILLEQKKVTPDASDNHGKTPLLYASLEGHLGIVKKILGREEVNPDKPDHTGQTPLAYAASKGHVEVVKILLGREDVDPDKQSNYGCTPLSQAALYGHEDVVKALLERQEVNPDSQDNGGSTPLQEAASNGHEGLVKILLGREEVNPDRRDNKGQTPLFSAAKWGREGVVKMLLERKDVNPNRPDQQGKTPLMSAQNNGHKRVIELLEPHKVAESKPKVKRPRHRLVATL